jgi:hypothetical protein
MKPLSSILLSILSLSSLGIAFLPEGVPVISGHTLHHKQQTELEIHTFLRTYFGLDLGPDDSQVPFNARKARDLIKDANAAVDSPSGKYVYMAPDGVTLEKNWGAAHFDDEFFQPGQDRLMILRSEMISFLQTGDVEKARIWLGRQLHALQDFYAHSNWVEIDPERSDISDKIGKPGATVYSPSTRDTCTEYCEDTTAMSQDDFTSYEEGLQCYRNCFVGDMNKFELFLGGTCAQLCDSLDDICLETAPSSPCGTGAEHACQHNVIDLDDITSGYYLVKGVSDSVKPAGKCTHGGLNDDGAKGIEGINKDSLIKDYAPHWFYHLQAAALSRRATQQYFNDLTQDWGDIFVPAKAALVSQPALTHRQLELLFGVGSSTLAFVIDTTGSMGDIIGSVQETVKGIVNGIVGTDREPVSYVLFGYNDPVGSNIIQTPFADAFLKQLDSFFADGGDDCPEPAISAVNIALDDVEVFSNIFVFTDAEAKDPKNLASTIEKAQTQSARVNIFQFPSECSSSDSYKALSYLTGGQYFGLTERTATPDLVTLAIGLIRPDGVNLFQDTPPTLILAPLRKRAAALTEVLVDSTMRSLTISCAGPARVAVLRPDGTTVANGDASVNYTSTVDYTYVTIANPMSGTWTVSRSETTSTSLSVTGESFLTFNKFDFVELKGSHPGMFPINETIIPGKSYEVVADVEGNYSTATFQFRDSNTGALLTSFDLVRYEGLPDLPAEHVWFGNVTVPCAVFYAYVIGKDSAGASFQRYYPTVFGQAANCTSNSTTFTNSTTSRSSSILSETSSASHIIGNSSTTSSPTLTSNLTTSYVLSNSVSRPPTVTSAYSGTFNGQGIPMTKTIV